MPPPELSAEELQKRRQSQASYTTAEVLNTWKDRGAVMIYRTVEGVLQPNGELALPLGNRLLIPCE